ncbi:hypothetical protein BCR44DRAFT_1437456 [Catenaria anguillulae PL171]|uniref:Armadillo-type protein n=1 Tax=Catenaria anguillulae PL171 TaxID=765915 RepID=A0A1Y2HIL4_9FUNG|nr:hypothetical protein BCR44DRAFT_1437456 [Catenaria anguillulae PL171]
MKKQDSGLILPFTLTDDMANNNNDDHVSRHDTDPLAPVTLTVSNLSLNLGTVPLPIPRKLAPLSRPSTASSRSSASSSSSSSSQSLGGTISSDSRPTSSSNLDSAASGPSLARTMADLDLALRSASWQHIPHYLAHLRTLLSAPTLAKDWLARNGLAQLVRVTTSLNATSASLDPSKSLSSMGMAATLNLARLASAAIFSPDIRQAAAGARLMYAVGALTETLSDAHQAAEPWIDHTIRVLAQVGVRYLELDIESQHDQDVWEWLIKTIRCLANLFQDQSLGTHHAHNHHLSILIDLVESTTTACTNPTHQSEELQLNLLLLLNNISFYPPPSATSNHYFTAQSKRCWIPSPHIEALGVLANLVRMPDSNAFTIMTEAGLLDAAVQGGANAPVLVPLCGVWTNLVGCESDHDHGQQETEGIVDVLSIAIESTSEPLVRVWSRLLMNVLVAFDESKQGIDEVRSKVTLGHVDEVGAYLDEAERKGIKGSELVKEVMDKLVEMDLGPEADQDQRDLEPLPEP